MFFDTHAHYDDEWFDADREELLATFDKAAAELLYLGLTAEELAARITALKGGEAQ